MPLRNRICPICRSSASLRVLGPPPDTFKHATLRPQQNRFDSDKGRKDQASSGYSRKLMQDAQHEFQEVGVQEYNPDSDRTVTN